jgi:hypothetical protein
MLAGMIAGSPPADPRWCYDDPSGVPDEVSVAVQMPERLLDEVRVEAARRGVTPAAWLVDLVDRTVRVRPTTA